MATRIKRMASKRPRRSCVLLALVAVVALVVFCFSFIRNKSALTAHGAGSRALLAQPALDTSSSLAAEARIPVNRTKIMAFIGINTGFGSRARREALRRTWYPSTAEEHKRMEEEFGVVFRFVIGQTSKPGQEDQLQEEIRQYGDFMRLNITEQYLRLNNKIVAYFKEAYRLYDAKFYVKADDDIYLRTDRLAAVLRKERSSPRTYLGCLKKGGVIGDPKMKWFEPKAHLLGKEYFLHAYGPIYALSADVVNIINSIPPGRLRMFINEDVTIGSWMLAFDVVHEQNLNLCSPVCRPHAIAVWDIPKCSGLCDSVASLPLLHNSSECREVP